TRSCCITPHPSFPSKRTMTTDTTISTHQFRRRVHRCRFGGAVLPDTSNMLQMQNGHSLLVANISLITTAFLLEQRRRSANLPEPWSAHSRDTLSAAWNTGVTCLIKTFSRTGRARSALGLHFLRLTTRTP